MLDFECNFYTFNAASAERGASRYLVAGLFTVMAATVVLLL